MRFNNTEDIKVVHDRIRDWVLRGLIWKDDAAKEHRSTESKRALADLLCDKFEAQEEIWPERKALFQWARDCESDPTSM